MNDRQLLKLLRADPADGINEAICTYSGLLTAVAMRILKDHHEVEECVADTFISMWKNIHTLSKADNLKAYLLCMVRNNAIDRYRRLKKQNMISIDSLDGFEIVADDDVELLIVKNEFMATLQKIIMKLPEQNRDIFMRKYFLFESIREIAENLNLTEVQVKDRLYRARKQLRDKLKKKGITYNEYIHETVR